MKSRKPITESLAGSLLLAHPGLKDPNFRRAVVLLSAHDEEGAMGVVLNRSSGKTLAQLDEGFRGGLLADVPVFDGGPVQPDRLLICGLQMHPDGEGFRLHFGLEPAAAESLVLTDEDVTLRAFMGYSGWGAGQLEHELEHGTWAVSPIPADMMIYAQDDALWRGLLSLISHEWKLLAEEPDDPSVN